MPSDFATSWTAAHQASLSFTISWSYVHWVGDAIQPPHPLLCPPSPALSISQHQGLSQLSQLFASGGQSIGASASASALPMNILDWFPLGWTGLISLPFNGLSRVFCNTTVQKHQFFVTQPSLWLNLYFYMTTGKTIALTIWTFVGNVSAF